MFNKSVDNVVSKLLKIAEELEDVAIEAVAKRWKEDAKIAEATMKRQEFDMETSRADRIRTRLEELLK